jgi:hypothetical protein
MENDAIRVRILREGISLTTGDRNETYGEPFENMALAANLFNGVSGMNLSPADMAMAMVCMKLSRLAKTPGHRDSVVDAATYLAIYYECYQREQLGWGKA